MIQWPVDEKKRIATTLKIFFLHQGQSKRAFEASRMVLGTLFELLLLIFVSQSSSFVVSSNQLSFGRSSISGMGKADMRRSRGMLATKSGEVQVLGGIREIADRYDTFLLDMWGVMHDGTVPYEGVLEVVQKLKEGGKDLIILSNSSKRQDNSIKMLTKLGFNPLKDFSQIITSGEVSYQLLSKTTPESSPLAPQPWDVLEPVLKDPTKRKVFCFGSGDGDEEYLESCGWSLSSMEEADLIFARGTFTINDGSTVVDKTNDGEEAYIMTYKDQLAKAAERKIPMIVANPDKIRPDKARSPMPGTIGNDYERAMSTGGGGTDAIKYIGKPFSDVFEIALRGKDRSRICMIGDALETDVTGGTAAEIDTIWVVNDGVHNMEIESKGGGSLEVGCSMVLEEFNFLENTYAKDRQLLPTVVLPHFRW